MKTFIFIIVSFAFSQSKVNYNKTIKLFIFNNIFYFQESSTFSLAEDFKNESSRIVMELNNLVLGDANKINMKTSELDELYQTYMNAIQLGIWGELYCEKILYESETFVKLEYIRMNERVRAVRGIEWKDAYEYLSIAKSLFSVEEKKEEAKEEKKEEKKDTPK